MVYSVSILYLIVGCVITGCCTSWMARQQSLTSLCLILRGQVWTRWLWTMFSSRFAQTRDLSPKDSSVIEESSGTNNAKSGERKLNITGKELVWETSKQSCRQLWHMMPFVSKHMAGEFDLRWKISPNTGLNTSIFCEYNCVLVHL